MTAMKSLFLLLLASVACCIVCNGVTFTQYQREIEDLSRAIRQTTDAVDSYIHNGDRSVYNNTNSIVSDLQGIQRSILAIDPDQLHPELRHGLCELDALIMEVTHLEDDTAMAVDLPWTQSDDIPSDDIAMSIPQIYTPRIEYHGVSSTSVLYVRVCVCLCMVDVPYASDQKYDLYKFMCGVCHTKEGAGNLNCY